MGPVCFPQPLSLMALKGPVYNRPMLLEAISTDATCSLHQVVILVNGRLIKVQLQQLCVDVVILLLSGFVSVHPAAEEAGC